MDINFELYKIFYHSAREKSFSIAAQKLFITQSAVSQAIKSLEDKTGTRLFIRKARSLMLTREGDLLFKHVEQAYNFIKAGENKLLEEQNLRHGEIRIGAGDTVCRYHLIPYLESFNAQHPNIRITIVNRTTSQLLDALRNGAVDFSIVTLPVNEKGLKVMNFMETNDIFVAGNKYSMLKGQPQSLKQLMNFPLLLLPRTSSTRRFYDSCFSKMGISLTAEIELESIELLVEFARIGFGIAHVLKESAEKLIQNGELFKLEVRDEIPQRQLGIVTSEGVPLNHASEAFIRMICKNPGI